MKRHLESSFSVDVTKFKVFTTSLALIGFSLTADAAIIISATAPTIDGGDQGKVGASDSQNFGKSFNCCTSDIG